MNLIKRPDKIVFVYNPVEFVFETRTTFLSCEFRISIGGKLFILTAQPGGDNRIRFEISDILQSFLSCQFTDSTLISFPVSDVSIPVVVEYWDYDEIEGMSDIDRYHFTALHGGVSKSMLRYLLSVNQTFFDYRLGNYERQFLFTTRTNSRLIKVKETEITPLYYIEPHDTITVINEYGRTITIIPDDSEEEEIVRIDALNIKAIRKFFEDTYNEVSSYLSILISEAHVLSIAILPGSKTPDRLILRFRNSLGCYEAIEVTGKKEIVPEFSEEELYNVYDDSTASFVENRFRRIYQDKIEASAGWKTPEELNFIRDLLSSDDIQLIGIGEDTIKVHVLAEDFSMSINPVEPQSVDLTIRVSEQETLVTPSPYENIEVPSFGEWVLRTGSWNMSGMWLDNGIWKFN